MVVGTIKNMPQDEFPFEAMLTRQGVRVWNNGVMNNPLYTLDENTIVMVIKGAKFNRDFYYEIMHEGSRNWLKTTLVVAIEPEED